MGLLRFLLAITVVAAHSGNLFGSQLVGGAAAVQAFFIISGFYMGLILNKKYIGQSSYYPFISNRFLRIYPMFIVCLLLTIGLEAIIYFTHDAPLNTPYGRGNTFFNIAERFEISDAWDVIFLTFTNITIFFRSFLHFIMLAPDSGNWVLSDQAKELFSALYTTQFVPQAWSLDIELVFYLMAPLVARRSLKFLFGLLAALVFLRFGIQAFVRSELPDMIHVFSLLFWPAQLMFFAAGLVAFKLYDNYQEKINAKFGLILLVAVSLLTMTLSELPIPEIVRSKFYFLILLVSLPFIFEATKRNAVDRFIGETSYPIYIVHGLVITVLWMFDIPESFFSIISVIISFGFAVLLNAVIGNRIEAIRQKRAKVMQINQGA